MTALLIGFILPKQILYRMVTRYRRKLQEALPDTVDLVAAARCKSGKWRAA
jgi:hypothetical protein